jgi:hypothetical protein
MSQAQPGAGNPRTSVRPFLRSTYRSAKLRESERADTISDGLNIRTCASRPRSAFIAPRRSPVRARLAPFAKLLLIAYLIGEALGLASTRSAYRLPKAQATSLAMKGSPVRIWASALFGNAAPTASTSAPRPGGGEPRLGDVRRPSGSARGATRAGACAGRSTRAPRRSSRRGVAARRSPCSDTRARSAGAPPALGASVR